jgi:hypothetical protein
MVLNGHTIELYRGNQFAARMYGLSPSDAFEEHVKSLGEGYDVFELNHLGQPVNQHLKASNSTEKGHAYVQRTSQKPRTRR